MGNLITREKKQCSKCNQKVNRLQEAVNIDYKKEILVNLYCENCIRNNEYYDGYKYLGEIRYVRIEYK